MKTIKKIWKLLAAAAVVLFLAVNSCVIVTYPNEFTVVKQFGKIVRVQEEEGVRRRSRIQCCSMTWR